MELTLEPLELRDLDGECTVLGLSLPLAMLARNAADAAARKAVLLVGAGLERLEVPRPWGCVGDVNRGMVKDLNFGMRDDGLTDRLR